MSYLVLARKYRPGSFAEMAGQDHVVRTLSNALRSGHLAHAFLFTGPRGVGKTTSARLLAKCLNCERGPTAEPCGVCPPCLEIAEGRSVDVVEIDAASNNGVDNVRDIVEAVKYRPARDRFKIYVVDEVHMLSAGAFNALLKTLEEPPPHVKFVLATTDVRKVPETILSRCQRFDFRRLGRQQIVEQLDKVARAEGLTVSPGALALLARTAEGGMRDALSLLDQVRAACGETADDAAVAAAIGAVDPGAVGRMARALVHRDGAALLSELEVLHARGHEMKRVAEELVRHLRDAVVAKLVPEAPLDLPEAERDEVRSLAGDSSATQLTRLFDLAERAAATVKRSEQPRYALEVALLSACFLAPGAEVQELLARLEGLSAGALVAPRAGTPPRSAGAPLERGGPPRPPPVRPTAAVSAEGAAGSQLAGRAGPVPAPRAEGAAAPAGRPGPVPLAGGEPGRAAGQPASTARDDASEPLGERWRRAVAEVEQRSVRLAQALKQAVPSRLGDGVAELALAPGIYRSTVEGGRAEIEAVLDAFLGEPVRLVVLEGVPPPRAPDAGAAAAEQAPRSLATAEQAARSARSAEVRGRARAHPNIQEAQRILDGEVAKIDDL